MAASTSHEGELDPGMIVRRALFIFLLLGLSLYHLFFHFDGLTTARGIDQAQVAREISEKGAFYTKFLRPLSIAQINNYREDSEVADLVSPNSFPDVFHAPLNPVLNSVVLGMFKGKWEFTSDSNTGVYFLDRVIAAVSVILFLLAIFVSYLTISRIFDTKIAGISALIVLLSATMWEFTQSGLPQMLMLFLFSFGLYFLFKAIESQQEGSPPYAWVALTGGFFGLLALTHWLTMWLFFGLLFFSAFYFRPKGTMSVILIAIFAVIASSWGYRNFTVSGDPLGSGLYSLQSGLAGADAASIFRNYDIEQIIFSTTGFVSKIILNSLSQLEDLYPYLGSVVAAPFFFLSLLHPFKRPEIAHFRWCILSMWLFAVLGMTIYGLPEGKLDPNQLHILFAPIMAAYGLAFLTVVWNRIGFETNHPLVTQGHLVTVAIISAIPLLLPLPKNLKAGIGADARARAVWPPYHPLGMTYLNKWTTDKEIILSDMPWAVAWYANRASVWLPKDLDQYKRLNDYVERTGQTFAGVFLSPLSVDTRLISDISVGPYSGWREIILNGETEASKRSLPGDFPFQEVKTFNKRAYFYSDRQRWADDR